MRLSHLRWLSNMIPKYFKYSFCIYSNTLRDIHIEIRRSIIIIAAHDPGFAASAVRLQLGFRVNVMAVSSWKVAPTLFLLINRSTVSDRQSSGPSTLPCGMPDFQRWRVIISYSCFKLLPLTQISSHQSCQIYRKSLTS